MVHVASTNYLAADQLEIPVLNRFIDFYFVKNFVFETFIFMFLQALALKRLSTPKWTLYLNKIAFVPEMVHDSFIVILVVTVILRTFEI